jgi:WD40 repeat protein
MKRVLMLVFVAAGTGLAVPAARAESKLELVLQTGHTDRVASVSLSADGKHALTGSWDKRVILWDVETGKQVRTFHGHTYYVHSVSLSSDGKRVLGVSYDPTAILWDAQMGRRSCGTREQARSCAPSSALTGARNGWW